MDKAILIVITLIYTIEFVRNMPPVKAFVNCFTRMPPRCEFLYLTGNQVVLPEVPKDDLFTFESNLKINGVQFDLRLEKLFQDFYKLTVSNEISVLNSKAVTLHGCFFSDDNNVKMGSHNIRGLSRLSIKLIKKPRDFDAPDPEPDIWKFVQSLVKAGEFGRINPNEFKTAGELLWEHIKDPKFVLELLCIADLWKNNLHMQWITVAYLIFAILVCLKAIGQVVLRLIEFFLNESKKYIRFPNHEMISLRNWTRLPCFMKSCNFLGRNDVFIEKSRRIIFSPNTSYPIRMSNLASIMSDRSEFLDPVNFGGTSISFGETADGVVIIADGWREWVFPAYKKKEMRHLASLIRLWVRSGETIDMKSVPPIEYGVRTSGFAKLHTYSFTGLLEGVMHDNKVFMMATIDSAARLL